MFIVHDFGLFQIYAEANFEACKAAVGLNKNYISKVHYSSVKRESLKRLTFGPRQSVA